MASIGLPAAAQRVALATLSTTARARLDRRTDRLPVLGEQAHVTAVLRLGEGIVPEIAVADRHYVYPPASVHVTVSNLDMATVDVDEAVDRLSRLTLAAPTFVVDKLGCSQDTLFLRCVHDRPFDRLRVAVEDAFGVAAGRSPSSWLFRRLSFANIVRFDGRGEWSDITVAPVQVRCTTLEIVRTDRYLSPSGTTVLRRLELRDEASGDSST